jgi:hypothetical protein
LRAFIGGIACAVRHFWVVDGLRMKLGCQKKTTKTLQTPVPTTPIKETAMDINVDKLEAAIQELKSTLKEGLLASDIWDSSMGLSLAGYNPQPAAVALFTEMTNTLRSTLADSGFPGLNRYFFLDLEGDHMVMIIRHGNGLLQGILMNSKKVNLGLLMSVVLPKMILSVERARF